MIGRLTGFILAGGILLSAGFPLRAESKKDPVAEIESGSEGRIRIDIPAGIYERLLKEDRKPTGPAPLHQGVNKLAGYRIQVFSDGRNQGSLEGRAKARGNAVLTRFPKYRGQIYTFSSSPNWYTRVGNFRTSAEASEALAELKRAFPGFASEMRIVKSQIVIIK